MRSAAEIAAAVRSGRVQAVQVIHAALEAVQRENPRLNAFTAVWAEAAVGQAEAIDQIVRAGGDPGALAGVPFAVKNLFDVAGRTTLAGSRIEASKPPAARDAALVARMKAAGAVLVGALNMDEYAYGFTTENAHYGPTRNPHDTARIAGGSSGGSAAAVAAGLVPITLGSDTNGSTRVPAALCGVFGIKPTFGRLSRRGVFPFVHSLDHAGAFAATAADLTLAYDALQGPDPEDPALAPRPLEPAAPSLDASLDGLRVGVLGGWFVHNAAPEALAALDAVAEALSARSADLPGARAARAAAFCLSAAEGGSLHLANLRARPEDFDPATRDRLIAGALQPAHVVARAQRVRRRFLAEALELFERFDVLLAPATPFAAPPIGQATIPMGGAPVSVRANLGLYTQPISCIGLPVVAVPLDRQGAMPCGVQLIAAPWREALLLRLAHRLERNGVVGATQGLREPAHAHQ
jgi:AtzE family amidohydrolase